MLLFFLYSLLYVFNFNPFFENSKIDYLPFVEHFFETPAFNLGIQGPDEVCLFGGPSIATFRSGGIPTDFYVWKVRKANGEDLTERSGGYPDFNFTFTEAGVFKVILEVRRGQNVIFTGEKTVTSVAGETPMLKPAYLLCDNGTVQLEVFDPSKIDPSLYVFEWRNALQQVVGTSNALVVNQPGSYTVKAHRKGSSGEVLCPINLTAQVNLPKAVNIKLSASEVCHGGGVVTAESGGHFGSWYFRREGFAEISYLRDGSKIQFTSSGDLLGPGDYEIIFIADNRNQDYCPAEVSLPFRVNVPGDALFFVETPAASCGENRGVLTINALTDLDRVRVTRDNQVVFVANSMTEGQQIRIENLPAGIYTLRVGLGPCGKARTTILPVAAGTSPSLYQLDRISNEGCLNDENPLGGFHLKFETPFTGIYKVLNANGNLFQQARIEQQETVDIALPAGVYYLEVLDEVNCSSPFPSVLRIERRETVNFNLPSRLVICELLEWTPPSTQGYDYVLIFPDQKELRQQAGQSFLLDQAGVYTLIGIDPAGVLCPSSKTFEVEIIPPIQFEPTLIQWDCFGNRKYEAKITGIQAQLVDIAWYNSQGVVISRDSQWISEGFGRFTLEVKPKNSEVCPVNQVQFYVEDNSRAKNAVIIGNPICSGSSKLSLEANLEVTDDLIWRFHHPTQGIQIKDEFRGKKEVEIQEPGFYEVIVLDEKGCEIGRSSITVQEGQLIDNLQLPDQKVICGYEYWTPNSDLDLQYELTYPDGEKVEKRKGDRFLLDQTGVYLLKAWGDQNAICPDEGSFEIEVLELFTYRVEVLEETCDGKNTYMGVVDGANGVNFDFFWYDDNEQLVFEGVVFQPPAEGTYHLEVRPQGSISCPIDRESFEVVHGCIPQVVFPNAMIPGDSERKFIVFGNAFVEEMEVWIYNKWGNLVFSSVCQKGNSYEACSWDGTVFGEKIIGGVYHVKVNYYSDQKKKFNQKNQQLVVID